MVLHTVFPGIWWRGATSCSACRRSSFGSTAAPSDQWQLLWITHLPAQPRVSAAFATKEPQPGAKFIALTFCYGNHRDLKNTIRWEIKKPFPSSLPSNINRNHIKEVLLVHTPRYGAVAIVSQTNRAACLFLPTISAQREGARNATRGFAIPAGERRASARPCLPVPAVLGAGTTPGQVCQGSCLC